MDYPDDTNWSTWEDGVHDASAGDAVYEKSFSALAEDLKNDWPPDFDEVWR